MTKIALQDIQNLNNQSSAVSKMNNNSDVIETKSDTFLSRDGTAPNYMLVDFDMNGHRILNLPAPGSLNEPVRLSDFANGAVLTVSTAQIPNFPSKAIAQLTSVSAAVSYLYTAGFSTPDDNGGGFYVKVGGAPSHAGFIQTLDGAFWELSVNQTITPEQFGAVGDASLSGSWTGTDNTQAFKNLAGYINIKKSVREVKFGANKLYLVWPTTVVNQDVLLDMTATDGVTWDFNGSEIVAKAGSAGTDTSYCFYLRSCVGTTFKGAAFRHKVINDASVPDGTKGITWFQLEDDCIGTTFSDLNILGGRIGIAVTRTSTSHRGKNIKVLGGYFNKVFYGFNCQKSGDDAFIRNLVCENGGRSYFCYNVSRHDIQLRIIPYGNIIPEIPIGVSLAAAETNALFNTLEDITLDVTVSSIGQSMVGSASFFDLFVAGSDEGPIAIIKNIKWRMAIDVPPVGQTGGNIFQTQKTKSNLTFDSTTRGHIIENLEFSGNIHANGVDCFGFNLFGETDWSGENIRNISFKNLSIDGLIREAFIINAACFTNAGGQGCLTLRDVRSVGQTVASPRGHITLTNVPMGGLFLYNLRTPNFSTRTDFTPVWDQPTGTDPVVGNGSIAGEYRREGGKVTVNVELNMGSTTTFGDGTNVYTFTLPAPYNAVSDGDYCGSIVALAAGVRKVGVARIDDGTNRIDMFSDAGSWKTTVPATWANGDFIQLSITYDV
jgi:hypothetical protein